MMPSLRKKEKLQRSRWFGAGIAWAGCGCETSGWSGLTGGGGAECGEGGEGGGGRATDVAGL